MQEWFDKLNERERKLVVGGAIAALLIVLLGWLWPLNQRANEAHLRIERKQGDLAFVQMAAPEIIAAGPVPVAGAANESLVVVVDRVARESGLADSITSTEPSGESQLRVRLTNASFDSMLAWLARLGQQHGVQVSNASVDPASGVGLVNASVELRAAVR